MKKLSILLAFFALLSCSKTNNMANRVHIYYSGVLYSSNHYETTKDVIPQSSSNDSKSIKVTMVINENKNFVFLYNYTDRHSFGNTSVLTHNYFRGDILSNNDILTGKAYSINGDYIEFESY